MNHTDTNPMKKNWKWNALLVLSLVALVTLLAPTAEAGERLRVAVDEPFEIDGKVYKASTLTLKEVGAYTPTSTLNQVWVGNKCLGMMVARKSGAEGVASDSEVLFNRNSDGRLVLVGVAFRGEPAMSFHRVGAPLSPRALPQRDQGTLVATKD